MINPPAETPNSDSFVNLTINQKPLPVFDTFSKVFIVTQDKESYYVDIDGNFDKQFGKQV